MVLWTAALLEALLLGVHTWQVVRIVVFQVSRLHYGSHLVMVGWVASLVVIADGAASTKLSLNFVLFVCLTCAFDVLCVYVFPFLCVHMAKGVYMND